MKTIFLLLLFCFVPSVFNIEPDYSDIGFTDIEYTRDTEGCAETISFDSDGTFHYWEACGNPVGYSDVCEGYTYDADTNTVTLAYPAEYEDSAWPNVIEIIDYDETYLEVKIDGETVIFDNQE